MPLQSESFLQVPSPRSSHYTKELLTEQRELLLNWVKGFQSPALTESLGENNPRVKNNDFFFLIVSQKPARTPFEYVEVMESVMPKGRWTPG